MQCKKIAFTGSHGTGKSFAVGERYIHEKLKYPEKSVIMISENVRMCPFETNKESTKLSQFWIFADQMKAELEVSAKYDIVICDRTVVDCISYALSTFGDMDFCDSLIKTASEYVETYDEIVFKTIRNNNYKINDGFRESTDDNFRINVEENLFKIYDIIQNKYKKNINLKIV